MNLNAGSLRRYILDGHETSLCYWFLPITAMLTFRKTSLLLMWHCFNIPILPYDTTPYILQTEQVNFTIRHIKVSTKSTLKSLSSSWYSALTFDIKRRRTCSALADALPVKKGCYLEAQHGGGSLMLVMSCGGNRTGEKCSKTARKTLSHAQAAKLQQPHPHIVGTVCVGKLLAYVWCQDWQMDAGLGFPITQNAIRSRGCIGCAKCKDKKLYHWMQTVGLTACLITITHKHALASCCLMLRGVYFPVFCWHFPKINLH